MILSKSPNRNTFQKEKYLERMAAKGRTPENDPTVQSMVEYYDTWEKRSTEQENDQGWRRDNLEYDLRTSEKLLAKVRSSEIYAQNLYAAMCNREFQKTELWPVLKGQTWSCSWRYAGGIVADMRGEGDYIDWYCSGIRGHEEVDPENCNQEQLERAKITSQFVGEGHVTDEIRADLLELGWAVLDD